MSLYLIARIADQPIAIAADRVESVIEIEAVSPVPRAPGHVAGLTALRSRVLTLIDTRATLGIVRKPLVGLDPAVVVVIDGHYYGLLVDHVDDVATIAEEARPVPGSVVARLGRRGAGRSRSCRRPAPPRRSGALAAGPISAAA